jgi:membrane associated rhomboid family serine protease
VDPTERRDVERLAPLSRSAAEIFHATRVSEAWTGVVFTSLVTAAALALWVMVGRARLRSGTFFLVGLALLWSYNTIGEWRRVARASPEHIESPDPAQLEARERHAARLAVHRPLLTYGLLGAICLVSLLELGGIERAVALAGLVKPDVRAGEWWRALTATYMHGGFLHFWLNFGALRALGHEVEAYSPRLRLPLVYLVAALAGSVASVILLPDTPSIGASGGIMGLVGYLLVLAWRRPADVAPWLRRGALLSLGLTAYLGFFGIAFIDNAAHAGGSLGGALVGLATVPRPGTTLSPSRARALDAAGVVACVVLVAGALFAALRLLGRA